MDSEVMALSIVGLYALVALLYILVLGGMMKKKEKPLDQESIRAMVREAMVASKAKKKS